MEIGEEEREMMSTPGSKMQERKDSDGMKKQKKQSKNWAVGNGVGEGILGYFFVFCLPYISQVVSVTTNYA